MRKFTIRLIIMLITLALAFIFASCGGSRNSHPIENPVNAKDSREVKLPEWFNKPPQNPDYIYAPGTYKSTDMGFSIEQARQIGRDEIARQISTKVTNMMKRFQEETGTNENVEFLSTTSIVSKSIVSESLNGSRTTEQVVYKEGTDSFRAYVLMEFPIGMVNAAMLDKIKNDKNMYTRLRASQAFQELELEVEKYEKSKKQDEIPGDK